MSTLPENFVVWTEIAVTDLAQSTAFYQTVTKATLIQSEMGGQAIAIFPTQEKSGVSVNLVTGTPAPKGTGSVIHLATPGALEDTMTRVAEAGGEIVSPVIEIPEGRLAYAFDPDGNRFSVFEAAA